MVSNKRVSESGEGVAKRVAESGPSKDAKDDNCKR